MEAKTKKYFKIGGIIVVSLIAIYGSYKGYKYFLDKYKPGETGGKDKVITLSDGTTITVSAEQAKTATNKDITNLKSAMNKWKTAGKITQAVYDLVAKGGSKMTRYEIQRLMFYFDKGDLTAVHYGFTADDLNKFIKLQDAAKIKGKE